MSTLNHSQRYTVLLKDGRIILEDSFTQAQMFSFKEDEAGKSGSMALANILNSYWKEIVQLRAMKS